MKAARNLGLVVVIAFLIAFTADRVSARPCCDGCGDPYACSELCEGNPICTQQCWDQEMLCWHSCVYCGYCTVCTSDLQCGPSHHCDFLLGCCV